MRTRWTALALAIVVTLAVAAPAVVDRATASSADTSGQLRGDPIPPEPGGQSEGMGLPGPGTPRVHGFGQSTIFVLGVALIVAAGGLGVYTLSQLRRSHDRR